MKQQMLEMKEQMAKKSAQEMTILFWMVTEDEYGNLRSIEGCEKQWDLPATVTDT